MSAFLQTIELYKQAGYEIKTSLNPMHFSHNQEFIRDFGTYFPFTFFIEKDKHIELRTGGGISNNEVFMFETLANVEHNIHNIFIIGNAFGYSAVILSLLFPNAKVVCIDAGIDGADNMLGINLTNTIAKSHNLNISVEFGFSPKDTKTIIQKHFNTPLNLVFIDGLHTNEQLLLDFEETQKYCNKNTIWVMHDVINYHMQDSFEKIKKTLANTHITKLLYRTQSGIGFAAPAHNHNVLKVLEAFSENDALIAHLSQIAKGYQDPLRIIKKLIPRPIKTFIKAYLR